MSVINLWEYRPTSLYPGKLHADPGGGLTLCGYVCQGKRWIDLGSGSLYDVNCQRCVKSLRASGDLP